MLCENPFGSVGMFFPCGRCLHCRINRQQIWRHRIMLEAEKHSNNAFVTLTYDDEHMPLGDTLVPADTQKFMKRLRKALPGKIRFYLVGEYGDQTWRPHYHVILFGYPACLYGQTRARPGGCCHWCDLIASKWKKGITHCGSVTEASAAYTCKYVLKRLTYADDPRLNGRHPEFSRMSNRPGIGASAMEDVARVIAQNKIAPEDVPSYLQRGRKHYPLGRYLQRRLRKELGRDEQTPEEVLAVWQDELRSLREAARSDEENPAAKHHLLKKYKGRRASKAARFQIFEQRKKL